MQPCSPHGCSPLCPSPTAGSWSPQCPHAHTDPAVAPRPCRTSPWAPHPVMTPQSWLQGVRWHRWPRQCCEAAGRAGDMWGHVGMLGPCHGPATGQWHLRHRVKVPGWAVTLGPQQHQHKRPHNTFPSTHVSTRVVPCAWCVNTMLCSAAAHHGCPEPWRGCRSPE